MWGSDIGIAECYIDWQKWIQLHLQYYFQDLEEQRNLLSEAARALQSQEEKHQEKMRRAQQQLAEEQVGLSNFAAALGSSLHIKLIVG